ncbi:hypothetical protein [Haloarcula sp. CBA1129]|uniref:hypothetical protein n=1 Tax=Haloarcula sp. CBA1129 TaxID=1853684 RepID=UPI00124912F3|nr:hypothetical protein [Haloarcula sp. CBA1129]KAA9399682.1 hypothetical protein Har1129_16235 [Haloarcula sp. CBA1129]
MQSAITQLPIPEVQTLAYGLLWFLGGMAVPTRYGMERVEGFGRAVASKLPYKAPPGTDEQAAMQEATGQQTDTQTDSDGGN